MPTAVESQNSQDSCTPTDPAGVAEFVRGTFDADEAVLPVGGGTALDYGNSPSRPVTRLELSGLSKVVDYTPRDMTILVEAGIRMVDLAALLAGEGQQLPIDVPRATEATIGGVVATNWCGPRRYGHGTIRDYVIGIHAVDGRGVAFKGGGRVVKNVAGYDFCKLLTGSLGTLGVITQVALKVKPQPEFVGVVIAECRDLTIADDSLRRLAMPEAPPVAIDLLVGGAWEDTAKSSMRIVARLEGTEIEVDWLADRVAAELDLAGAMNTQRLDVDTMNLLWEQQVEFADRGAQAKQDVSPLVLQFAVPPSDVAGIVAKVLAVDADCSIQAHAASGIIVARFAKFTHGDLTAVLAGKLRPAATHVGGHVTVVTSSLDGLTPHLVWGGRTDAVVLLEKIKQKFDPKNILNPGKFIY
jgi:glycolate oxidase FAD binding subunit